MGNTTYSIREASRWFSINVLWYIATAMGAAVLLLAWGAFYTFPLVFVALILGCAGLYFYLSNFSEVSRRSGRDDTVAVAGAREDENVVLRARLAEVERRVADLESLSDGRQGR